MKREITSARIRVRSDANAAGRSDYRIRPVGSGAGVDTDQKNVVERLRDRIVDIQSRGLVVRTEWLDGEQASWCEIRGVRTIMLDASQPAAEQLIQLDEILTEISRFGDRSTSGTAIHDRRAA